MQQARCLVRSSVNIDETFQVPHIVRPGETISSSKMWSRPGGKGANVAAALGSAGTEVVMLGAVGEDATWPLDHLKERGVIVDDVHRSKDVPTGRAFIQISSQDGENSIVLLKGANFAPVPHLDDPAKWLDAKTTHLMLQNEIPLETTIAYVKHARTLKHENAQSRVCTVFNPSPMPTAEELRSFPWQGIDVLIVNQGEASDLLSALQGEQKESAIKSLAALEPFKEVGWLVMTRGGEGFLAGVLLDGERVWLDMPAAKPEKVVNTTGAGDTFAGYLVAGLMHSHNKSEKPTKESIEQILFTAGVAASMAVEIDGAMESIPDMQAVEKRQAALST
ncbi:ribokinase [Malassezia psittaci]|uniref:Ribokinase n=1 Tax=Malassezia psittaci TaxID=1821823 RepID=A0AAF0F2A3_9BASI|nr:ribokinase [Malassezia psittaci]